MGYAIADQGGVLFWSEFRRLGGVARLGYPSSRRFVWGGFVTQLTQKAVLQWRPELRRVCFANVFDDLSQAGKDPWLAAARSTPAPLPPDFDRGKAWPQVMDGRLALLKARPAGTWRPAPGAYAMTGQASWYGPDFVGKPMASGAPFDTSDPSTCASNAYPLGSRLRVTSLAAGASVEVVVRNTGPFAYPRVVDLSSAAFQKLGYPEAKGVVPVRVELLATAGG